ncbi:MAG TPA: oligosaccharide flippase family protein, partial [Chloroflexota bacterium]|nr:oligosaccharide flippase family protein [Chloroflexota bacterium]
QVSYQDVIEYALPSRQIATFLLPEIFGSPTRHHIFDITTWTWREVGLNALGSPTDPPGTIFWGIKNYVEGAGYVGLLPLIGAAIALLTVRCRTVAIFGVLAAISLAFAFGTPLYRILFFGIPGFDQLHTPFRWLFPFGFAVAVLGAVGLDQAFDRRQSALRMPGALAMVTGLGLTLLLIVVALIPGPALTLAARVLDQSERIGRSYGDASMLLSHQWQNAIWFAVLLAASGVALWLASTRGGRWAFLVVVVLTIDLFSAHYAFNTRVEPGLLVEPPVVQFLRAQPGPFRITSFGREDALKPITPMLMGIEDIRGYDTVITRRFATFWGAMDETSDLMFSMLHKLYRPSALSSPYLAALNVEYILTVEHLDHPNLELVFDGQPRVYRLRSTGPRVMAPESSILATSDDQALALVGQMDLRRTVILSGESGVIGEIPLVGRVLASTPDSGTSVVSPASLVPIAGPTETTILRYETSEVAIRVRGPGGYLVLHDAYAPGWRAEIDGLPTPVHRANYLFRAVEIPPGEHEVVFQFRPLSLQIGLGMTMIGVLMLALVAGLWFWLVALVPGADSAGRRVVRNSFGPLGTSLFNRAIDLGFAFVMLRILQPENVGKYAFAIVIFGYLEIVTNFGLNTLLIREVSREPDKARYFVGITAGLRLLLWLVLAPATMLVLFISSTQFGLATDTALAAAILLFALLPGNVSAALSSFFYARERMEVPAAVAIGTTLLRVALGLLVLLLGTGIIGLAMVSVVVNIATAGVFYILVSRHFRPRILVDLEAFRQITRESYPLMLNHLLATLFFRVDILMLNAIRGDKEVGLYATGYKYIDGLLLIPSTFTFAIFPLLSRYAGDSPDRLLRAYRSGIRLLVMIAVPITLLVFVAAEPLILLAGGRGFLPDSARALQILIWFLPFSFVNGLTQYVLIAVGEQKVITVGFVIAVAFNVSANAVLLPTYGYPAAAATTVASEIVLMAPFLLAVRRSVGDVRWRQTLFKPVAAALVMVATLVATTNLGLPVSFALAGVLYLATLIGSRVLEPEEALAMNRLFGGRLSAFERWHARTPRQALPIGD